MKPLVSISITAFNHEKYIAQAIESVLAQKVNFNYEILLGEDESKDTTRVICKKYAAEYPDKIRLFLNSRDNVIKIDGRPTGRYNLLNNFKNAKGKYIALLDGDDYWTDENKLQIQVDFLEANSELSFCFHDLSLVNEKGLDLKIEKIPSGMKRTLSREDLIAGYYPCPPLGTLLFKKNAFTCPEWFMNFKNGDLALTILFSEKGNGGYIDEKMTAYRQHGNGMWSANTRAYKLRANIKMRKKLLELFFPSGYKNNCKLIVESYLGLINIQLQSIQIIGLFKDSIKLTQFVIQNPKSIFTFKKAFIKKL